VGEGLVDMVRFFMGWRGGGWRSWSGFVMSSFQKRYILRCNRELEL
jgi:hypothetical protein